MFLNGDIIYRNKDYRDIFNMIFKENARITQKILAFIKALPSKTLRRALIKLLRSKFGSRSIAYVAERNIKKAM